MNNDRELRLSLEELQNLLKTTKLIKNNEVVHEAYIEPGELILKITK